MKNINDLSESDRMRVVSDKRMPPNVIAISQTSVKREKNTRVQKTLKWICVIMALCVMTATMFFSVCALTSDDPQKKLHDVNVSTDKNESHSSDVQNESAVKDQNQSAVKDQNQTEQKAASVNNAELQSPDSDDNSSSSNSNSAASNSTASNAAGTSENAASESIWESGIFSVNGVKIEFPGEAVTAEEICRQMSLAAGRKYRVEYCQYHSYVEPALHCDANIVCPETGEILIVMLYNGTSRNLKPQECMVTGWHVDSMFHEDLSMLTLPGDLKIGDTKEKVRSVYGEPSSAPFDDADYYWTKDTSGDTYTYFYIHYQDGKIANFNYTKEPTYNAWIKANGRDN